MLHGRFGLTQCDKSRATPGYTLFSPTGQFDTYVVDMNGDVVHQWKLPEPPGNYTYLLANGNLIGAGRTEDGGTGLAAKGGHLYEMDWNGKIVWEHFDHMQHHDYRRLPNGNTVYLAWELMSDDAARRVGGGHESKRSTDGSYADVVREIDADGNLVWQWRVVENMEIEKYPICPLCDGKEFAHANSIFPLPNGDYLISFRHNHLIATIDRKTKKFSWEMCDWVLGHQHDVQMLDDGKILVFANGAHAPWHGPEEGSRLFEIDPDNDNQITWEYKGTPPYTFDSPFISGCQRLASGNTLVCEGRWGRIFEITRDGDIVWNYVSPYLMDKGPMKGGNAVFRAYRYAADSPEINGRLPALN